MAQLVTPALLALDIGACKHAFAFEQGSGQERGEVANDPAELRRFLAARTRRGAPLRVLVEATGIYYLDVALIAAELGAEVMVVNPKAAHNFSRALQQRNKTDALDAAMLLEFLKRMPFVAWTPPRRALLELRHYGRYLTQLTEDATAARNRLHALTSSQASPRALRADLQRAIVGLDKRIDRLRQQAVTLIQADPELRSAFYALTSIVGVAQTSAVSLLSELAVLPRHLSSRACVCHAGLDVRIVQSGTSVAQAPRISRHGNKYLRRALYYPALSASRHDPHATAFQQRLLARGKKKMQALVAIMRKLLTAAWALIKHPAPYDGRKLYAHVAGG
jgi:transposase